MNVLILTPDAVGSTLLQRLITIYMQFHEFDRPVINLHELSNGLDRYYSPEFNQEVLGKSPEKWGYYQTLHEIVDLLESVDHYKTSRLAQYHLLNRDDPISEQIPFYQYLNDNFYIIACRRQNVFEHSLSWAINKVTGKLNVYSAQEKVGSFVDMYYDKIEIDPESLINSLEKYKNYLAWVDRHFHVANYFEYEKHLPDIENYVLNLPIFAGQTQRHNWKDIFDIEFNDWNLYHYLASNVGSVALDRPGEFRALIESIGESNSATENTWSTDRDLLIQYNNVSDPSWPRLERAEDYAALPERIKQECRDVHGIVVNERPLTATRELAKLYTEDQKNFLVENHTNYKKATDSIDRMKELGIVVNGPPIKKQTMAEKRHATRNFDQLLATYNTWAMKNPEVAAPIAEHDLEETVSQEREKWQAPVSSLTSHQADQLSIDKNTD